MSNSPPSPGPDLFFAGGECLTRFGVWVRRTDVDLEEATKETAARASEATAIGRDGILRTWGIDNPRGEWLNEVNIDPTRNLFETTDVVQWDPDASSEIELIGGEPNVFRVTDTSAAAQAKIQEFLTTDGTPATHTFSVLLKKQEGQPTFGMRLGSVNNHGVIVDAATGDFAILGTPDAVRVTLTGGNYWLVEAVLTQTGDVWLVDVFPAYGFTVAGGLDVAAVGFNDIKAPQFEAGTIATVFQETPRDVDRKFPSLFLENSTTNTLLQSENLGSATWEKSLANVTVDAVDAPDGTFTADKLFDDNSAASAHSVNQPVAKAGSSINLTFSVYLKPLQYRRVHMWMSDNSAANRAEVIVNLATGTIVGDPTDSGTGWTPIRATITALPDGWFRCTLSATSNADTIVRCFMYLDDDTGRIYDGDGSSGIAFWGMQLEQDAPHVSSYIPTGGATAARSADSFAGAFPHPPVPMTVYTSFIESGTASDANLRIYQFGGLGTPSLDVRREGGGRYQVIHSNGIDSVSAGGSSGEVQIGQFVELRSVLFADGSVQIFRTLDFGDETSPGRSDPQPSFPPLAPEWANQVLQINSANGSVVGLGRFLAVKVQRGVRDRRFMRRL